MTRDPKTKEQFLNRIMSYDFDGDFSSLGEGKPKVSRIAANKVAIDFPMTGQHYELVVRKPRVKPVRAVRNTKRVHIRIATPSPTQRRAAARPRPRA